MSLSSLIVQREIATIREIEEALARQVLYGGDFVTNLFEVSRIEEATLMAVVAESFGLPPAPTGELPKIPEDAVRLVAAEVAAERAFSPLEVGASLVVAVAAPLAKDAEQELAFALALPIEQRIAPLFRIRQALARDYGVPIDKRTARLITKIIHKGPKIASTFPPPIDSNPGFPLPARPPSVAPPPKRPEAPATGASALAATVAVSSPPGQATLVRKMEAPPARPPRRRRGPVTLDVAISELEASAERDVIFDVLFEFARQFFDYAALFIVHGEIAEGRDASGDGASREKVARIGVPLDLPSMLQRCRADKRLLRSRPAPDGIDPVLMADLGREGVTECIVFPIIVRSRVVALLFGDGGPSGIDDVGVRQVEGLMESAAGAFERVIMRRKLKGQDPSAAGGGVAGARLRAESLSPPPTQISAPPLTSTLVSERPAVEELASPIRELFAEPVSRVAATRREPTPDAYLPEPSGVSDQPPPKNLLAVRRPSGQPIPREEPDPSMLSPSRPPLRTSQGPNRTGSGSHKRAEAPPLEFGAPQVPSVAMASVDAPKTRRETPADFIPSWERDHLDESIVSEAPYSPKAMSPPPMPAVKAPPPRSTTDPSAQPIDLAAVAASVVPAVSAIPVTPLAGGGGQVTSSTTDKSPPAIDFSVSPPIVAAPQPVAAPVHEPRPARAHRLGTGTLLEGMSPPPLPPREPIAQSAPISPLVVITPDEEIEPVGIVGGGAPSAVESSDPVMALSSRKGVPPPLPEPKPMPPSEQQVSVPAHKPPSSRSDHSRILPSVIVDMSSEYVTLVERVLKGPDEEAETDLLRAGGYAMPAIMARFPGPIGIEADRLVAAPLPRVAECGPILRLVASQRRTALPFVLANVEHPDPERRFWSVYLLTELVYPDAIDATVGRVFDADAKVRLAARAAARALAEAHPQTVVERIGEVAKNEREPKLRRIQAIEALGEAREPNAVGVLVPFIDDPSPDVTAATRSALVTIARQDFGGDGKRWAAWWEANKSRHRLEWLIDALMHDQRSIRGLASDELRTITKEYFGYYDDLPKRERERAQARYREWWESIGKVRFSRAATRGQ